MVTANVDIPTLKAQHPLGDTVEASGVRLRGRGRVRQGVCPFHDEAEGSFTVYADSERWYCFGCGLGGDVLDFIQHVEGLSLPDAIARLDGSPGLAPRAANRPAGTRRPKSAALPPRDPALLTAAARFYAGRRAAAGPGVPRLLREANQGLRAVHGAGSGAVRRHGGRSRPRIEYGAGSLRRPRPLARRASGRSRPDSPLPGSPRPQAGAGSGSSRPRPWLGGRGRGAVRLARPYRMGSPRSPRPCGAAPASFSPSMATTRDVRRRSGF